MRPLDPLVAFEVGVSKPDEENKCIMRNPFPLRITAYSITVLISAPFSISAAGDIESNCQYGYVEKVRFRTELLKRLGLY